ncbi:DoxX family protein [Salinicola rhizosphaerae]|uniref:DoxX family protein n=1 Tax=Salinicola rhizosphaerae TaxID=1443141 RepID=A0ABQ3DYU2_9GAMM|nr:DoxX family protein [Salinicola rhizosphaerae]GHB17038.1 hypothetical protein GCM10009038_14670 [Salinicola rhizosphaerae]
MAHALTAVWMTAEGSPSDNLAPEKVTPSWISALYALMLLVALWSVYAGQLPDWSRWTVVGLLAISLVVNLVVTPRWFRIGFLVSLLTFVTGWRVAAMHDVWPLMIAGFVTFLALVAQFADAMRKDWQSRGSAAFANHLMWQLALVRLYFGVNEVGHATEKIFAGQASFEHMATQFGQLGTPMPGLFVIAAGLVEFSLAIGVGLGLFTRFFAALGTLYFLVATVAFGHEWVHGYAWDGSGWEYIALLIVFYVSLLLSGGGRFSIDGWLLERGLIPHTLIPLCTPRAGYHAMS